MGTKSSSEKTDSTTQDPPPTALEWTMRAFSALVVLALFGFLVYSALQPHVGPSFDLQVHEDEIEERAAGGWAVPFTITNRGTVAIGDVLYEMKLLQPGNDALAKQGRIAIFGAGESVNGEVWFERDPRDGELRLYVDTYSL